MSNVSVIKKSCGCVGHEHLQSCEQPLADAPLTFPKTNSQGQCSGHGHDKHLHDAKHDHEHAGHDPVHGARCGQGSQLTRLSDVRGAQKSRLRIQAMDCPTEARLIEKALAGVAGVAGLSFDFFERILTVEHDLNDLEPVIAAIGRVGMQAVLLDEASPAASSDKPHSARSQWLFAISGVAAVAAECAAWGLSDRNGWVMALALISILSGGLPTLKKGWISVRSGMMNIHFLMSVAVIGALLIGQWPEAAMVLFLFAVAEKLEAMSLSRVGRAVRELMNLAPATAFVADGQGGFSEQPVASVALGTRLRVRPGERVPLDGEIVEGQSAFNEAPITGESLPRDKGPGAVVFAGSINGQGVIELVTTAAANDSILARIIASVRDAQESKAPTQRFIDQFAGIYTPVVVLLALAMAILLPMLTSMSVHQAVYQALVLLVIACPCAMVIATPVTLVSALAAAARYGLLIKGGEALERAARVRAIAFDKTGTLTTGRTAVADVRTFGSHTANEVLSLAAALDAHSTHPLARALIQAAEARQLVLPVAANVREQAGLGVEGVVAGRSLALGSRRLAQSQGALSASVEEALDSFEAQGQASLLLLEGAQVLGVIAVADKVRSDAASTVSALAALGIRSVILSGDNQRVVSSLARVAGVEDAQGGLLPQDKLERIKALQQQYGVVAMVGDGVNDAPALARADLGIAMGAASDTALETASVALMEDRLAKLPKMLGHARRTLGVLKFNLGFALVVKLVFFALALSGHATLWMAVLADVGASLIVVANGLRMARALRR